MFDPGAGNIPASTASWASGDPDRRLQLICPAFSAKAALAIQKANPSVKARAATEDYVWTDPTYRAAHDSEFTSMFGDGRATPVSNIILGANPPAKSVKLKGSGSADNQSTERTIADVTPWEAAVFVEGELAPKLMLAAVPGGEPLHQGTVVTRRRSHAVVLSGLLSLEPSCEACREHDVPQATTQEAAVPSASGPSSHPKLTHLEADVPWGRTGLTASRPRFSVDGRLFWQVGASIWSADLRSGQWRQLVRDVCVDELQVAAELSVLTCRGGGALRVSLDGDVERRGPHLPQGKISPDGRYLACTDDSRCIVDTESGRDVLPTKGPRARKRVEDVVWADDSSCVYRSLGSVGIGDYATAEVVCPDRAIIQEHPGGICSPFSWSSDGEILAGGCGLWDVSSPQARLQLGAVREGATALAFRPDSHELAIGQRDGTVWVGSAYPDQQAGRTFTAHASAIAALAWTADGATLASADRDGLLLLQHGNGAEIGRVQVGRNLEELRFSLDRQVVVGVASNELVLIRADDFRLMALAAVVLDDSSIDVVAYDDAGDVDGSPRAAARLGGARSRRDGLLRGWLK